MNLSDLRLGGSAAGVLFLLTVVTADGAPSDVDPSFGTGGIASTAAGPPLHEGIFAGAGIARQADGSVIIVAESAGHDFLARRFDANGALDAGFGVAGSAVVDLGGDDEPFAVALQSDGAIVIVGTSTLSGNPRAALVRLTETGVPDATFGDAGKVVTSFAAWTTARDVALQTEGSILIVGDTGTSFGPDFFVARYDDEGVLDPSFGVGGVAIKSVGASSDGGFALAIQPDGAILAGGFSFLGGDFGKWLLVRFLSGGTPDPDFGTDGVVETDINGDNVLAEILDIALQPDGKILAAGSTATTQLNWPSEFAVARYLADGTLDESWGSGGITITPTLTGGMFQSTAAHSLALQAGGKVIAVGGGGTQATFPAVQVIAARYQFDGTLDPSWGGDGLAFVDSGFTSVIGTDAVLQPDGRLLIGTRAATQLAAIRLIGDPPCGDGVLGDDEQCDDGNVLSGDCCSSTCTIEADGSSCDDGDVCTGVDACASGACEGSAEPAPACGAAGKGSLSIKDGGPGNGDLAWQWKRGAATPVEQIPAQHYTLCVYDGSPRPQPIARIETSDTACGESSCFKTSSRKTLYSDRAGTSDGLRRLLLKAGTEGRASAKLVARGASLTLPSLPLEGEVTAQVHGENGVCMGSTYGPPQRNDPARFKAKTE